MPFRNAAGGAVVGHAAEGGARGGPTLVNERGPELGRTQRGDLMDLQGGMTVVPAGQSAMMAAAAAGGRGGGGGITIDNRIIIDGREMKRWVTEAVRDEVQSKAGGDPVRFFRGRGRA
jgi:hypothetical protein